MQKKSYKNLYASFYNAIKYYLDYFILLKYSKLF